MIIIEIDKWPINLFPYIFFLFKLKHVLKGKKHVLDLGLSWLRAKNLREKLRSTFITKSKVIRILHYKIPDFNTFKTDPYHQLAWTATHSKIILNFQVSMYHCKCTKTWALSSSFQVAVQYESHNEGNGNYGWKNNGSWSSLSVASLDNGPQCNITYVLFFVI